MSDDAGVRPATDIERSQRLDCLRCGSLVTDEGTWTLRTGGHSGAVNFFFGAWGELGEGTLDVDVFHCPNCGHMEFRTPPT